MIKCKFYLAALILSIPYFINTLKTLLQLKMPVAATLWQSRIQEFYNLLNSVPRLTILRVFSSKLRSISTVHTINL